MTKFSYGVSGFETILERIVGVFLERAKVSVVGEEGLRLYHCRCFELFDLNYAMNIFEIIFHFVIVNDFRIFCEA
jgi:hypothetical protein